MNDRDRLDGLLDASAPTTALVGAEVQAELVAMTQAARSASRRRVKRRVPRLAATGVAVAFMVGGVGAAAAISPPSWAPWAQEPGPAFTFNLPSGARCNFELVDVTSNDPALTQAVKDYVSKTNLVGLADVEGALRANRLDGNQDKAFNLAVASSVFKIVNEEMKRQGWDVDDDSLGLSMGGQADCPGAKS